MSKVLLDIIHSTWEQFVTRSKSPRHPKGPDSLARLKQKARRSKHKGPQTRHQRKAVEEDEAAAAAMVYRSSVVGVISLLVYAVWMFFPMASAQCDIRRNIPAVLQPVREWTITRAPATLALPLNMSVHLSLNISSSVEPLDIESAIYWACTFAEPGLSLFRQESGLLVLDEAEYSKIPRGHKVTHRCKLEPQIPQQVKNLYKLWGELAESPGRSQTFLKHEFGWYPCPSDGYTNNEVVIHVERVAGIPEESPILAPAASVSSESMANNVQETAVAEPVKCEDLQQLRGLRTPALEAAVLAKYFPDRNLPNAPQTRLALTPGVWSFDPATGASVLRMNDADTGAPYKFVYDMSLIAPQISTPFEASILKSAQCIYGPLNEALARLNKQEARDLVSVTHPCAENGQLNAEYSWKFTHIQKQGDRNRNCYHHGIFAHQWRSTAFGQSATATVLTHVADTKGPEINLNVPQLSKFTVGNHAETLVPACVWPASEQAGQETICVAARAATRAADVFVDNCFEQDELTVTAIAEKTEWFTCSIKTSECMGPLEPTELASLGIFLSNEGTPKADYCVSRNSLTPTKLQGSVLLAAVPVVARDPCDNVSDASQALRVVVGFVDAKKPSNAGIYSRICM